MKLLWLNTMWTWISNNSASLTMLGTWITGIALAFFALLTHKLSKKMVEFQYAPPLQLYSSARPETGQFDIGHETIYKGVRWEIHILNSGEAPILAAQIDIEIAPVSGRKSWTSIGRLCHLQDQAGNEIEQSVVVGGHSHITISIVLFSVETVGFLKRTFGDQKHFIVRAVLYQYRHLLGKKPGWLTVYSEPFELPSEFGTVIKRVY